MGKRIKSASTVKQMWSPVTLKMEAIFSPKRRVKEKSHGVIPKEAFVIVIAVKTPQKAAFYGPT
jgi:hypothetical protein